MISIWLDLFNLYQKTLVPTKVLYLNFNTLAWLAIITISNFLSLICGNRSVYPSYDHLWLISLLSWVFAWLQQIPFY